jgi:hypothetical protein
MARRRQSKGTPAASAPRQVAQDGGALANWPDRPSWIEEGDYGEITGGILVGELASRLAEDHRRRRGRQKPR